MNSAMKPIFNENFIEKKGLWVPWTIYGTHWQMPDTAEKTVSVVSKRSLSLLIKFAHLFSQKKKIQKKKKKKATTRTANMCY